jgi:hypothetical protein
MKTSNFKKEFSIPSEEVRLSRALKRMRFTLKKERANGVARRRSGSLMRGRSGGNDGRDHNKEEAMMKRVLIAVAVLALAVPALAVSAAEKATPEPVKVAKAEKQVEIVNAKCPLMGTAMGKTAPENMTRMYKGQRVGFCCGTCLKKWDAMNDADREATFKTAMGTNPVEIVNAKCPIMGTEMEKTAPENMTRMYQGQRVGFCCDKCLQEWDKMSAADRDAKLKAVMKPAKAVEKKK